MVVVAVVVLRLVVVVVVHVHVVVVVAGGGGHFGQEPLQLHLLSLEVHLGGEVLDDPGPFVPFHDGVAKLAQQQVPVDDGEVLGELLLDVLDAADQPRHGFRR